MRQAPTAHRVYTLCMALRIKELREDRGWTQEVLASRANISRSQLAMIEKGSRPANTLRLSSIAAALGVPVEALFYAETESAAIMALMPRIKPADRAALVRLAEAFADRAERD